MSSFPTKGYLFIPTDEELVSLYLGQELPYHPILENDEANPCNVFTDDDDQNTPERRVNKTAGCGTCYEEAAKIKIKNKAGQVIETRTTLDLRTKKLFKMKDNGHGIMYESSLDGVFLDEVCKGKTDYVACKIIRDELGKRKVESYDQERREPENKKQKCCNSNSLGAEIQESEWGLMSSDMDSLFNMVDSDATFEDVQLQQQYLADDFDLFQDDGNRPAVPILDEEHAVDEVAEANSAEYQFPVQEAGEATCEDSSSAVNG